MLRASPQNPISAPTAGATPQPVLALPDPVRTDPQDPILSRQDARTSPTVMPWRSAGAELRQMLKDREQRGAESGVKRDDVMVDGKVVATFTSAPTSLNNTTLIVESSRPQLTVSPEGVFLGSPSRRVGARPDGTFPEGVVGPPQLAVVTQSREVDISFLPVSTVEARTKSTAGGTLLSEGTLVRVADNSGVPQNFSVANGQTLVLTMPLPVTGRAKGADGAPDFSAPLQPLKPSDAKFTLSHSPTQEGNIEGVLYPESNFVLLPNGSQVMMQPGAKLQVQYQTPSGIVSALDFTASGPVTESQIRQANLGGAVVRDSMIRRNDQEAGAQLTATGARAEADRAVTAGVRIRTVNERERDGVYEGRLTIGDSEWCTVVSPPKSGVDLAIRDARVISSRADLRTFDAAKRSAGAEERGGPKLPPPSGSTSAVGDPIRNGVLIIDNSGSTRASVDISGTGRAIDLPTPTHIVSRGPLEVNLAGGKPDQYLTHPLTIRAGGETSIQPVTVHVDHSVETDFFERGDAFRQRSRWQQGLVVDAAGKVTGFQPTENGPIVQLLPGQTLTILTGRTEVVSKSNQFAINDSLFVHQPHEYRLTGGTNKDEALKDLEHQHTQQLKRFPTIEIELPPPPERPQPREEMAQMVLPPVRSAS